MSDSIKIRLTLPRQNLTEPSLFRPSPEAAETWIEALPIANTLAIAELLNVALSELNHLQLPPRSRYQILETLRPRVDLALGSLHKKYLNQPLVIPREPGKLADLAEQLLLAAGTAYTIVAVEAIQQREQISDINPARLTCEAIHHALVYCGRRVLQAFQLYRPLPIHGWQVLHQLYALAENQELTDLPLQNQTAGGRSIRATYLQSLVLGCCKPNQLRQSDLESAYHAMTNLSELAILAPAGASSGLFAVDLASDQPPLYTTLLPGTGGAGYRVIDTSALVQRLQEIKSAEKDRLQSEVTPLDAAEGLPGYLLDHLIDSLGSMSMRNFSRTRSRSTLRVCLGLSSTHFHVAGRKDFEHFLVGTDSETALAKGNPFLTSQRSADIWSLANPEVDYVRNEWLPGQRDSADIERQIDLDAATRAQLLEEVEVKLPLDERYPIHKVAQADASPGGYCLEWTEELPSDLRAGDIVSIMEDQGQDWAIAVIRWLSRLENARTLIGLELLSPRAKAFAAMIHLKNSSKGAAMRVLLLPEIKLVGQPHTILTPRASFREHQRITLVNQNHSHTVELTRQIASTASYSQFEFRTIKELGDVLSTAKANPLDSPYDSLWSNI